MIYKNVLFIDHVVVVHARLCPTLSTLWTVNPPGSSLHVII